jgi:hypothetical protein
MITLRSVQYCHQEKPARWVCTWRSKFQTSALRPANFLGFSALGSHVRIVPTAEPRPHAFQTANRQLIRRYIVWVDNGVVKHTTITYINWNIWYGTKSLDTTWTRPMYIFTRYFPMTHHSVFLPRPSWSSSGRSTQSLHQNSICISYLSIWVTYPALRKTKPVIHFW